MNIRNLICLAEKRKVDSQKALFRKRGEKIFSFRKVKLPHPTLNIAHRGARILAPENTIAAAKKALKLGVDGWELDVRMTRDKNLIVIHDDTLDRTSNVELLFPPDRKPWLVKDFTLEEIQKLDFGSWFNEMDPFGQIATGNVSTEDQKSYAGESTPTLREALEFTKKNGWMANIEIKVIPSLVKGTEITEKIVDLIEELEMEDEVIVSSFNHRYTKWAKELNPRIAAGVLVNEPLANSVKYLSMIGADAYHPKASAINLEEIRFLRDQGFGVNVWTVNDEKLMMKSIDAEVSGIITDFPQKLQIILQEKSLRRE